MQFRDGHRLLALHGGKVGQTLRPLAVEIGHRGVVLDHAAAHFEVGDPAGKRIRHGLVNVERQRLVVAHGALEGEFAAGLRRAGDLAQLAGSGRELDEKVHPAIDPKVGPRGGEQNREHPASGDGLAQAGLQMAQGNRALVEELLHQGVVVFGDQFDQRFVAGTRGLRPSGGNVALAALPVAARRAGIGALLDEIDDALKILFLSPGQLREANAAAEAFLQGGEGAFAVGAIAVHAVDHEDRRQVAAGGEAPDLLRLHFHAGYGVHHDHHRFDGGHRQLGFVNENVVAGRVEEVDLMLLPLGKGRRGGDAEAPRDLFLVEVGRSRAFFDSAQPRRRAGGKERARNKSGFPASAVADDGEIAQLGGLVGLQIRVLLSCEQPWRRVAPSKATVYARPPGGREPPGPGASRGSWRDAARRPASAGAGSCPWLPFAGRQA